MNGVDVEHARYRAERHVLPISHARYGRPDSDILAFERTLVDISHVWTSSFPVNTVRPIDLAVRVRRNELSVAGVEHVKKATAVGLHHDFARISVDIDGGNDRRLHRIIIERVLGCRLEVPHAFASFRPNGKNRIGEEIVSIAGAGV